jgi:predicted solute-binding protein
VVDDVVGPLAAARDRGIEQIDKIAEREAPLLGISLELAKSYLRENLHFTLGCKEVEGLRRFYSLCVAHELAPAGLESALQELRVDQVCPK